MFLPLFCCKKVATFVLLQFVALLFSIDSCCEQYFVVFATAFVEKRENFRSPFVLLM